MSFGNLFNVPPKRVERDVCKSVFATNLQRLINLGVVFRMSRPGAFVCECCRSRFDGCSALKEHLGLKNALVNLSDVKVYSNCPKRKAGQASPPAGESEQRRPSAVPRASISLREQNGFCHDAPPEELPVVLAKPMTRSRKDELSEILLCSWQAAAAQRRTVERIPGFISHEPLRSAREKCHQKSKPSFEPSSGQGTRGWSKIDTGNVLPIFISQDDP